MAEKTEITGRGRTYFIRRHVVDQMKALGIYDEHAHWHIEFGTFLDIVRACDGTGIEPVVTLLPADMAFEVNKGEARLVYQPKRDDVTRLAEDAVRED